MSGLFSFNPDAQLGAPAAGPERPPAPVSASAAAPDAPSMPDEWAAGIDILMDMPMPYGATIDRWAQITDDATTFARRWHEAAATAGWTTGNIFGFGFEQPDGFVGLVFHIRGGRFLGFSKDEQGRDMASIKTSTGYRWVYRDMPDDARPLWRMRGGR